MSTPARKPKLRVLRERVSRRSTRETVDDFAAETRRRRYLGVAMVGVLPDGSCDLWYEARTVREKFMLLGAADVLHGRIRSRYTGDA